VEWRAVDAPGFRGTKSADQQPALWIPNLDRRDWVVGGATTPAAAKKALAFAADVATRARKRAAAALTHQLELFANAATPPIKLPLSTRKTSCERKSSARPHSSMSFKNRLQSGKSCYEHRGALR
jgi:hypothetical protein